MKLPRVSIIIPCRNEELFIEKNIRSCFGQSYKGEIEVLLVDGMSDDKTREIVEKLKLEYPKLRLIDNQKRTTPFALNIGINESEGAYFVILGGHAELDENFIENNLSNFVSDAIGCTGGVIENVYLNNAGASIGKAMSSKFGVGNATFRVGGEKSKVDTVAFGMYKKSIIDTIGVFDERLVRNQDDEYNYRVSKEYEIIFDPSVNCKYFVRGNFVKLFKQYFQYGYWKVFVNTMHKTVTTGRQLVPALFVLFLAIGFTVSLFNNVLFLLTFVGISSYLGMAIYFAAKKCDSFVDFWMIVLSFLILHISYGLGYWKGIIHFLILKRMPTSKSMELTR